MIYRKLHLARNSDHIKKNLIFFFLNKKKKILINYI